MRLMIGAAAIEKFRIEYSTDYPIKNIFALLNNNIK